MSDDVATCASCGAPLLLRTDEDGRTWLKCTGEHGWMRVPFMDADHNTDEWRERREEELAQVSARWDSSQFDGTSRFNEVMQEDRFALLGEGQAVLVAIGALEEDELRESVQAESFSVARIAAKLGWSIDRTLDGLSHLRERDSVEVVPRA